MTLTISLTLLVPAVAVAIAGAGRRLFAEVVDNVQGIALQTVIIMVVLLAIAGSVAAVLISSGQESVDDLEAVELYANVVTTANCPSIKIGSVTGAIESGSTSVDGSKMGDCVFPNAPKAACELYQTAKGKAKYVSSGRPGCLLIL